MTVVGARPQFIKAAVLSREIKTKQFDECIIHTGQHFDENMSKVFFEQMQIPKPDYHLEISNLPHGAMTGRMLEQIESIINMESPDLMMVYGDTNSTLAGALAASKLGLPIAHVEAGLRSFNMQMPEEINRILTDRVSQYLFCPTLNAVENLRNEGYDELDCHIVHSGDIMQDAFSYYRDNAVMPVGLEGIEKRSFILCTVHRAENTNHFERLSAIIDAINLISEKTEIVIPLHPRTENKIRQLGLKLNATIIEPVGYLEMIWLLDSCGLVLTDSGGLQKEAFFARKPCVTMRNETEWVELIKAGVNLIAGASQESILSSVEAMIGKDLSNVDDLYGNGMTANVIVNAIMN